MPVYSIECGHTGRGTAGTKAGALGIARPMATQHQQPADIYLVKNSGNQRFLKWVVYPDGKVSKV